LTDKTFLGSWDSEAVCYTCHTLRPGAPHLRIENQAARC
jgi:hypothetical protein